MVLGMFSGWLLTKLGCHRLLPIVCGLLLPCDLGSFFSHFRKRYTWGFAYFRNLPAGPAIGAKVTLLLQDVRQGTNKEER